jgi:hypothetical protein
MFWFGTKIAERRKGFHYFIWTQRTFRRLDKNLLWAPLEEFIKWT